MTELFAKFEYLMAGDHVENLDPLAIELFHRDKLAQRFSQLPTTIDTLNSSEFWIVSAIVEKEKEAEKLKETMEEANKL